MAVLKWSISIEEGLGSRVEKHVGHRGLSAFVARAVEHELERVALADHLDALDEKHGEPPVELIERYDALWPS